MLAPCQEFGQQRLSYGGLVTCQHRLCSTSLASACCVAWSLLMQLQPVIQGLGDQAGLVVAAIYSKICRRFASAAPHLRAKLQHKKLVALKERGSPPACLAECAKEGVEQRKEEWPHARAPTIESVAALMQIFLALDIFAKGRGCLSHPGGTLDLQHAPGAQSREQLIQHGS